jgi:hypothetical protein
VQKLFYNLNNDLLKIHASIDRRAFKIKSPLNSALIKTAFDTRRINSEKIVNPRRNLQNYQRSEPFIDNKLAEQINTIFKLKRSVDTIKNEFETDFDWLDSNTRILCNAIDRTLRIHEQDGDFFKPQFDYLSELLYLRYRLSMSDIDTLSEPQIKLAILNKDEKLLHKQIYSNYNTQPKKIIQSENNITEQQVNKNGSKEDSLIEKLFGNVKASQENKDIERSVIITIKDKINTEEDTSTKDIANKKE